MILIKQKTRKMCFFGLHKCMRWLRWVPLCAALTVRGLGGRASPAWCDDCCMAEDNGNHGHHAHHGHQDQAKAIHLFLAIFFRTSELLSQCFSACFCHCCAFWRWKTPNRKTWPISHWLFVVAGKSWKGVLAISSASTGCLGRILKWRRRMSDWNSV